MKKSLKTILLSLLVMALWGSLFPMVKLGYSAFDISAKSVPDILMFASYRFIISGLVVSLFCFLKKEKIATPKAKSILNIVIMGLFSIVLHYACTYIGLSTTDSSKTALIKQLGALIYVCFAFLFFKNEKFSILKIIGAIVGFGGIIAINYNPDGLSFAVGDILIIGASICTVVANVISKKSVQGSSPYWITGISQLFGGIVLFVAAVIMGADFLKFNLTAALIFTYICIASICSYTLWYYVLKSNSLSKMFIIKFAEPLFACLFGALILGENILKWQYLIAFLLISFGIVLGNKSDKIKAVNNA
ncbi:MAG: DMT family transporter [Clostridia bacterium]|nr:DMT family transporter [Clostridia bacterium]MBQ3562715.1 DMT family transporter [Clostridia bacterium]